MRPAIFRRHERGAVAPRIRRHTDRRRFASPSRVRDERRSLSRVLVYFAALVSIGIALTACEQSSPFAHYKGKCVSLWRMAGNDKVWTQGILVEAGRDWIAVEDVRDESRKTIPVASIVSVEDGDAALFNACGAPENAGR